MSTQSSNSVASMYGVNPSQITAQPAPPPVDDSEALPVTEVLPGVFYDEKTARDLGYEKPEFEGVTDFLGQLFTGKLIDTFPPADAYTVPEDADEAAALRESSEQAYRDARTIRMSERASEFNTLFNPDGDEVAQMLNERAAMGQSQFYLADTDEQYQNNLENIFGEDNVRIIKDEGPYFSIFDAGKYVSVRRDDGTFTDFEPVTVSPMDYAKRVAPGLVAEIGASTAVVGGAFATSAGVGMLSGPFGVVTAPVAFVWSLYAGGKGIEMGRQYLQDELGLNEEEAFEFSNFLEAAQEAYTIRPSRMPLIGDEGTPEERARELSATLEVVFTAVPGLKTKIKAAAARARASGGRLQSTIYGPAKSAQETIEATKGQATGETADAIASVGVPLESLMLQQTTSNKLIGRLASLAEQTSTILPKKAQAQMQSVVQYLRTYGDNVGEGNFKEFQSAVTGLGETLTTVRNRPQDVPENLSDIGENLGTLEDLFLRLRGIQVRGMYDNVFDKLGNASYDLEGIRVLLPGKRTIVPTTAADATAKAPGKVVGDLPVPERGEQIIDNLVNDLLAVGRVQKDGTRILTPAQIRAAVKDFADNNPEFNFDLDKIDTPAKLLQVYASRFGQLSKEQFGEFGATHNPKLAARSAKIRRELLELIGNPREELDDIDAIRDGLTEANAFYRETDKLVSQGTQVAARQGRLGDVGAEPAILPETIGTTPAALGRSAPGTATLEAIQQQEAYVRSFLNDPSNFDTIAKSDTLGDMIDAGGPALQQMRGYFADSLAHHLSRSIPTDAADVTDVAQVVKFLDSFEPKQLRLLGIDETMEAQIRNDATLVANLQKAGVTQRVIDLPTGQAKVADVFEKILSGDSGEIVMGLNELMIPIRRMGKDEAAQSTLQLRAGLLNHIFSVDKGIFKTTTSNSAYGEVGQMTIDVDKFYKIINQMKRAKVFEGPNAILTKQDEQILDAMAEYTGVISTNGADAGSALAGAQIIGEMFTIDPGKFLAGVARLGSQGRISKLFADEDFVKLATGTGKPMSAAEKIQMMFFGKTSMGSIAARAAMELSDVRETEEEQTDRMLDAGAASGSVSSMYGLPSVP